MNSSVAIGATVGSGVINSKKKTDSGFRTLSVSTRDGNRTRTAAMATGFSYHYGFRHSHFICVCGLDFLFIHMNGCRLLSLYTFTSKLMRLARDCHVCTEVSPNLSDSTSFITEGALKFSNSHGATRSPVRRTPKSCVSTSSTTRAD